MDPCTVCTWRNNMAACAMGVGDEEGCPGFGEEPCEYCGQQPCICDPEDEDTEEFIETVDPDFFGED